MKRLLFIIVLLAWAHPSYASYAHRATATFSCNNFMYANITTLTCTASSNPSTTNLICVYVLWLDLNNPNSAPASMSVADSNGNAYTKTPGSPFGGGGTYNFYLKNAPANATGTITATFSATGTNGLAVILADVFTDSTPTTTVLDQDTFGSSSSPGTAITTPTINATGSGELIYATCAPDNAITVANAPWTIGAANIGGGNSGIASEFQVSASSTAVNFTQDMSGNWSCIGMSFQNCTATKVVFTAQPADAAVGASLGTVSLTAEDGSSNRCVGDTSTVTITNNAGCTGMTLGGTASGSAVAGVFTTTNLTENAAGACTLHAADGALTAADSTSFTISAPVASASNMFFFGVGNGSLAHNYQTNFPLTENPISEGSSWTNAVLGGSGNGDPVQTNGTMAYATIVSSADDIAIRSDAWAPNVTVIGTIQVATNGGTNGYELELLCRITYGSGYRTGYEFNINTKTASGYYRQLVKLDNGGFSYLYNVTVGTAPQTGDTMKLVCNGSSISIYYNNTLLTTVTEGTYATGKPGIGFDPYNYGSGDPALTDAGFKQWRATEN